MQKSYDKLTKYFDVIKDDDESIIWVGSPEFIPFILKGVPFLMFGILWGTFDFFFFLNADDKDIALNLFMLLHMAPLWLSIGNFARLILVHPNTHYAYTNKRLLLRSGFWGIDFKSIDFDKISDIEVNVNPIEAIFSVGSILTYTGRVNDDRTSTTDNMIAIKLPYEVFKQIKKISVDVKTDWNYPNALRPEQNPGYKTNYTPK